MVGKPSRVAGVTFESEIGAVESLGLKERWSSRRKQIPYTRRPTRQSLVPASCVPLASGVLSARAHPNRQAAAAVLLVLGLTTRADFCGLGLFQPAKGRFPALALPRKPRRLPPASAPLAAARHSVFSRGLGRGRFGWLQGRHRGTCR